MLFLLRVAVIFLLKHIWKLKLETNSKIKNIRDLWSGINDFKKGYQPRINRVKDEKFTDCHSILVQWRNRFSQLFNVQGVRKVRQTEIHTAEPLEPELHAFEVHIAIEKLKGHKSPGTDQIPAKMIKAGRKKQFAPKFWRLYDRASLVQWYQQPTRWGKICFIDSFKLVLHVSGNIFAHLQEHFDCIYCFLEQCTNSAVCCRLVTQIRWNWSWFNQYHPICVTGRQQTAGSVHCSKNLYVQSKCSWRWAKLSPETCTAILKESIKQMLLHLVGWYHHSEIHKQIYIWNKEELHDEWKESIFVPLYKRGDKANCSNNRCIWLLQAKYKILSNILLLRSSPYAEEIIGDHQCGFRRKRSTTDYIFCIHQILEKKWEYNKAMHQLFIGLKKVYDSVV